MRSTFAEINLSNLNNNYLSIRRSVKGKKVMAVVKADAYGHGVDQVTKSLNSLRNDKPEYYAVAFTEEAIELRELKVNQPILVFDPINNIENVGLFFKYDLIPTVFTEIHLKTLINAKKRLSYQNKIKVHIKIDTGMNRLGIDAVNSIKFIKKVSSSKHFIIDGIYTHFATSDEKNKSFANRQLKIFKDILEYLAISKINYGLAHSANSGAILNMPDSYLDMVRPGILLYGYYPSMELPMTIMPRPVMSLISKVSSIKKIMKGDTVSYGRKYKAARNTNIISVPIGYADGFNRNLSNFAKGIINGKEFMQIGTVTMDRIMFDIGNSIINIGDKVILLGKEGKSKIDAWDWAKILGTIPYEIICGIGKRVPRTYVK